MDALHLAHLVFVSAWGGVVAVESVIELADQTDAGLAIATRLHYWIDVAIELPLILAVLATGTLLASNTWPPSPWLVVKLACSLVAIALNFACVAVVIRRYRQRIDASRVRTESRLVRMAAVGFPFGLVAAYLGLTRAITP